MTPLVSAVTSASRILPIVLLPVVFVSAPSFAAPPAPTAAARSTPTAMTSGSQPKVSAQTTNTNVWSPSRMDIRGLSIPAGYEGAIATHIDDEGRVYGYAIIGSQYFEQVRRAVRWTPGGVVTKVGPDNAVDGAAIGLMDGQLVYWARTKSGGVDKLSAWVGTTEIPNFVPRGIQNSKVYGWKYSGAPFESGSGWVWPAGSTVAGMIDAMNGSGVIAGTGRVPQHHYWYCVRRAIAIAQNGAWRSPIPRHGDHRFRRIAITRSA